MKNKIINNTIFILFMLYPAIGFASEFRALNPILMPSETSAVKSEKRFKKIDRNAVEKVIRKFISSWNSKQLDNILDDGFFDKNRLSDSVNNKVPRDARLRLLSVDSIQTVAQIKKTDVTGEEILVSTIRATIRTQIEFNDPNYGYQAVDGTNELVFEIKTR